MRPRILPCLALVCAGLALGRPCFADEANMDEARKLARQALDDLDAERWQAALESAQKAEELYHAPIHLLAIARALEGLARLAEAADTYERLVAEPLPPRGAAVFKQAQDEGAERLRRLLARVPSLLVNVRGPASGAARLTIDGKAIANADAARRLDPGPHTIRVEADGYETHEDSVTLPNKGGTVVVEVAMRQPGGAADPPPPPGDEPDRDAPSSSPLVVPTVIAFSVGGVGLAVGAVTGGLFLSQVSDLKDRCPGDRCPASEQENLDNTALLGNVTTGALAVGGAGAVVGFILLGVWLSGDDSSSEGKAAGAVSFAPEVGPGWVGLRIAY